MADEERGGRPGGPGDAPRGADGRPREVLDAGGRTDQPWVAVPRRRRSRWRTAGMVFGGLLLLGLVVTAVLWQRCGLRGCPDVDMLRGYMPDEASRVVDRNGEEIAKLFVTRRVSVGLDSVPEHVQNAFLAIEDKRFWSHGGVDWRRVLGALVSNVKAGGIAEGSSTITMQLARNVFPDQLPASERTLTRKLGEARVARAIEGRYSKQEILELYVNQIYFGQGAWGIEAASQEYFGKGATQLTLAEAATLAALPRAPSRLNPRANEEAAQEGRELVLSRMVEQGLITEAEREEAAGAVLQLRKREAKSEDRAPYFVEAVRRRLEDQLGDAIYTQGYVIHTTLDLAAQRAAETALNAQLEAIESGRFGSFPHRTYASVRADTSADASEGTQYLQGVMIVMEANTGDVVALIGGRDFDDSEFNRALQARRQPGSAFKPFVYAAAVQAGIPPTHRLLDRPLRMVISRGNVWEPKNYDGSYAGVVSMREALRNSKNVATVRLAHEVGMAQIQRVAQNMGLGILPSNPSVVLGTNEVTPVQLTSSFAAFATLGNRVEPRFVTRVEDRTGRTVFAESTFSERVIDPAAAYVTLSMLRDVVDRGTGTGVRAVGFRGPAAGKTGTTQDAADVWFVGVTPDYVGTVWIGFDKRQRILRGATGGEIAAPVWGRVLRAIGAGDSDWRIPSGVESHPVTAMGGLVDAGCPVVGETFTEYFLSGTAPRGADCLPADYLAYGDSFGTYTDSLLMEYEQQRAAEEEGWWTRMRERLFGDSVPPTATPVEGDPVPVEPPPAEVQPQQPRPDPLGTPVRPSPGTPRPVQPAPGTPPPVRPDTLRARPRPDTPARPRPDTTPARPRPDTTTPAPPDRTGSAPRPLGQPVGRG